MEYFIPRFAKIKKMQVKQQKDNDVTQKIIKKLEEDSEQYSDRFNILDNEVKREHLIPDH